ncbi:MAG: RNA ligase family protein [Dehalococcoidia bacterium]|jgi:hypothetical protein
MTTEKPLNGKAYGSIPHLPGSKFGNRDDKGIDEKAARFFIDKPGKHDLIIVLEKLDGSCVSVANIGGEIVPLIRSGYRAITSKYLQHHLFAVWVHEHQERFNVLKPGERICGEWLAQAHGTRYDLTGRDPFVAFDVFVGQIRQPYCVVNQYCNRNDLDFAPVLFWEHGSGCSIGEALLLLEETGHYGALERAEGCVWRWERSDPTVLIMMAKYVRPDKTPGKYLESETGGDPVWNWRPTP